MALRAVALLGDTSDHGGTITISGNAGTVLAEGKVICSSGATLNCPVHGASLITTNLAAIGKIGGTPMVLNGSIAACGAVIIASAIKTFSE